MKRKAIRTSYIPVSVGDKIYVFFDHTNESFTGIVTCIKQRLGLINDGSHRQSPLITAKDLATGKKISFDNLFVKAVLEKYHGPALPPYNYFRENSCVGQEILTDKKNVVAGPLHVLAEFYLARLDIFLSNPIDPAKLLFEYEKQKSGLIRRKHWLFQIRVKPFKKWLRKNAYKIIQTSAQISKEATLHEMEYEADAEEWLHEDEENELRESLRRDIEQGFATEILKRTPNNECGQC